MRKRCLYRGCREYITRGSYCAGHKPYGNGWAALRGHILRRDEYVCKCQGCNVCDGSPCIRAATTVDHIDGDASHNEPHNLQAMCRPCNTSKGGIA